MRPGTRTFLPQRSPAASSRTLEQTTCSAQHRTTTELACCWRVHTVSQRCADHPRAQHRSRVHASCRRRRRMEVGISSSFLPLFADRTMSSLPGTAAVVLHLPTCRPFGPGAKAQQNAATGLRAHPGTLDTLNVRRALPFSPERGRKKGAFATLTQPDKMRHPSSARDASAGFHCLTSRLRPRTPPTDTQQQSAQTHLGLF